MTPTAQQPSAILRALGAPAFWLWLTVALLAALLCIRLVLPIGPMYWDTFLYIDAAQRIAVGQMPSVDFAAPVGPLGYYLFAWGLKLFPAAQPLLLAQWSLLVVIAPLMAVVVAEVSKTSRGLAFALLIPALAFAAFPANAQFYHPLPGVDGFGIYNRQGVILLYVLTCGLLFLPDGRRLALFCAVAGLALFTIKITGFLVGGLLGVVALLSGRLSVRTALLAAVAFAVPLAALELATGMVSAYIRDILQLAALNEGTFLPRFRTVVSAKFDVIVPAAALAMLLAWLDLRHRDRSVRLLDSSTVWFCAAMAGGVIYETQNTGSQEFIFIWPVLLMIYRRVAPLQKRTRVIFVALAAFCTIPTASAIGAKTLRAVAVMPLYEQPDLSRLRNVGQVSARHDILARAEMLDDHFASFEPAYEDLARHEQMPGWQYYAEPDNQLQWLLSANRMLAALETFETSNNIRLDSVMTLDFTDPFPWILNRTPTRHVQIGRDPSRTVGEMTPQTRQAIEATAGVLKPNCPYTWARRDLQATYAQALQGRKVIALTPCWDLLLRPDLQAQ